MSDTPAQGMTVDEILYLSQPNMFRPPSEVLSHNEAKAALSALIDEVIGYGTVPPKDEWWRYSLERVREFKLVTDQRKRKQTLLGDQQ